MMQAGAVSYAQPSVTKVGGITEYLNFVTLAMSGREAGAAFALFRTGLAGDIAVDVAAGRRTFVEVFYMNRAACLWGGDIDSDAHGSIAVPEGPGLGYEPDREVMKRYRVS